MPDASTAPPNPKPPRPWLPLVIAAALATVTLLVFWPVREHDFIILDDPDYVTQNPRITGGLSVAGIRWAFTQTHASNWHPLSWISHMVDCHVFGVDPGPHHLVNVGFHALNSIFLFLLLRMLTGALWRSALVGTLFALHPLHVESVAWVAERKDMLSTFFWLATTWAYACYTGIPARGQPPRRACYLLALGCYALGLMSKPMLVTLPCVLMLLDFWPLGRMTFSTAPPLGDLAKATWRLLPDKLPFLALAAASSAMTVFAQGGHGAMVSTSAFPFDARLANATVSYLRYLKRTFWPKELCAFYPYDAALVNSWFVPAALALAGLSWLAWRNRLARPWLFVGWLWFLGTLVPVIGLLQVGSQSIADRYTYVPLIGVFLAMAWALGELATATTKLRTPVVAVAVLGVALCVPLTARQIRFWKNTETLVTQVGRLHPANHFAPILLGGWCLQQGRTEDALRHYRRGVELAPTSYKAHYDLASALLNTGQVEEASQHFQIVRGLEPLDLATRRGLGAWLLRSGQFKEAEAELREVLEIIGPDPFVMLDFGTALRAQNRPVEAIGIFEACVQAIPSLPLPRLQLAGALQAAGRPHDALPHYRTALGATPNDPSLRVEYAQCLIASGSTNAGLEEMQQTVLACPTNITLRIHLAEALAASGNYSDAIAQYRESLRLDPYSLVAGNNLAWILATHPDAAIRDGRAATQLAEATCSATQRKVAVFLGTLAAAYAESGRFEEAAKTAQEAIERATLADQSEVAEANRRLLSEYRLGRPVRVDLPR